jgi:hypothetical protein
LWRQKYWEKGKYPNYLDLPEERAMADDRWPLADYSLYSEESLPGW